MYSMAAASGSKFLLLRSLCVRSFSATAAPPSIAREVSATLSHPDWRLRLESSDTKAVVQRLVDSGEPAPQVLHSIIKLTPCSAGSEIFETLISIYKKKGCLNEACSVFSVVSKEKGLQFPSLAFCNSFLRYLLREDNRVDMFWKVYKAMCVARVEPDVSTYTNVISAHIKGDDFKAAYKSWLDIGKSGLIPNVFTYAALMDGYFKSDEVTKVSKALSLKDEMTARGIKMTTLAYNTIISGLCLHNETDEAYEYFNEMIASKSAYPDNQTYYAMIKECCEPFYSSTYSYMIYEVLNEMRNRDSIPTYFTYFMIIEKLCSSAKHEEAERLLEEMISNGLKPKVDIYHRMIEGHLDCFEYEGAKRILKIMKERGVSPDSCCYESMIIHLCYTEKMKEAGEYMVEMLEKGLAPQKSTYASLITSYSKAGNMQEADRYFKQLLNSGFSFSYNIYRYLMNGYFKEGNTVAALSVFKFMRDRSDVSDCEAYEILIQGIANHGRTAEAIMLFHKVESKDFYGQDIENHYLSVMASFCELNKKETALQLFDMLANSHFIGDDAYKVLIKSLCNWGDIERARQILDEATRKSHLVLVSETTYRIMIEDGYCKNGDQMEAFRMLEKMVKNRTQPDTYICAAIVDTCLKQGKIEEAFWFADEMVQKALVEPKSKRYYLSDADVWFMDSRRNYTFYKDQVRLF